MTLTIITYPYLMYRIFGFKGFAYHLIICLVGYIIMEIVEYIEHYGLEREKDPKTGEYVPVTHTCSWDSNTTLSSFMLFKAGRHSDHHVNAYRPY